MRNYTLSIIVTMLTLVLSYLWAGWHGLFICSMMTVMEISFSFDNAVVNALVLRNMSEIWQKRFLTWGMVITVFGMYYLFPLLIVSVATGLNLIDVFQMAVHKPESYSQHVNESHAQIGAFGGMFLLMVFLSFIFDANKKRHWLGAIEEKLAFLGKLEAVETILALAGLLVFQLFLLEAERLHALAAGVLGVVLYVGLNSVIALFGLEEKHSGYSGLIGFAYLNLLDASFSLDAVVGSFAISSDIVIIVLGLTAGAMFVRSLTLHLVREGTLNRYIFLEHGAHYAIGALAVIMLVSIVTPVPEVISGLIGVVFILLSLVSSVLHNRKLHSIKSKDLH